MLFGVTRVRGVSTHDVAVEKLRQQIVLGLLLPSERLPAERRLAEDLGVSRVTLREALRVLETEGYLVVTRGSRGGATIVDEDSIATLMARQVRSDPIAVYRAMEYWACNSQEAARFAAERRTPADLKRMSLAVSDMTTATSWSAVCRAEATFFLSLADAAANTWFADSIRDAMSVAFMARARGALDAVQHSNVTRYEQLLQALSKRRVADARDQLQGILDARWELIRASIGGKIR